MKDGETEDSGMHLRGVYGSQTDFDVDEYRELPNASSRSRAVASYRRHVNEDGSLDDVSDDELASCASFGDRVPLH